MRQTKFRAREITKGKPGSWVYGDYFSQYKDGVTTHYIISHPNGRDAGREVIWTVDADSVGEFSGTNDVYEGDILLFKNYWGGIEDGGDRDVTCVIEFSEQWAAFVAIGFPAGSDKWHPYSYEVIGNTSETPDLLKLEQSV